MRIILSFIFCFLYIQLPAQNVIEGEVRTSEKKAIEFATIVVQTVDSVFVAGGQTDLKGKFKVKIPMGGNLILSVTCVGFSPYYTNLQGLFSNIDLGEIIVAEQSISLEGVTVTAQNRINRQGRTVLFPSEQQLKASTNGLNILQGGLLPGILINPLMNTITTHDNKDVQLYINDMKVTEKDFVALQPSDIIRIEYLDNPGLRYDNAAKVIKYITRRYRSGGAISVDLTNSPHVLFGNDYVSMRYNKEKSEFNFNYSLNIRDFKKLWRSNEELYHFEDGRQEILFEEGLPGRYVSQIHEVATSYNFQEPEKYTFNVGLRYIGNIEPHFDYNSTIHSLSQPDISRAINDRSDVRNHFPSVDFYFIRYLNKKQFLSFNMVGTYIGTNMIRSYREEVKLQMANEYLTDVRGEKYSLIGEGLYEKDFGGGRLDVGIKHMQSISNNEYGGTLNYATNMKQTTTYLYAEYSGSLSKLYYTVGLGLNRDWVKQQDRGGYETYNLRPRLSLNYKITDNWATRVEAKLDNCSPGLADLSDVEQVIDPFQIQKGNPELSPYKQYQMSAHLEYSKGLFTAVADGCYIRADAPIMETTFRRDEKFVRSLINQDRWEKWNGELTVRVGALWDILQLSLSGGINKYHSLGIAYDHVYTNFYYRAEAIATYKKWMMLFNIYTNYNNFWGETIEGGENLHLIMVNYKLKNMTLGLGAMNPFTDNYKRINENWNAFSSYKKVDYLNESSRLFMLKLTWNVNFGRSYQKDEKRLYNNDSDSGVMTTKN